jgi:hypothetical protein
MNKRQITKCVICGKPVDQSRSTSVERETCKKVKIGNVWVKSDCEIEKNRRYQENYRKNQKKKKSSKNSKSVALSNNAHLKKHEAKTYKRDCLKCGKKFTGRGPYNRICNTCTIENSRSKSIR